MVFCTYILNLCCYYIRLILATGGGTSATISASKVNLMSVRHSPVLTGPRLHQRSRNAPSLVLCMRLEQNGRAPFPALSIRLFASVWVQPAHQLLPLEADLDDRLGNGKSSKAPVMC